MNRAILLSIHPQHAELIYAKKKLAELRKSFSKEFNGLVFLYETAPKSQVTGAFFTHGPIQAQHKELVELSKQFGVSEDRAKAYFSDRNTGWLIPIDVVIPFKEPIPLSQVKMWDHSFSVPQAYSYLGGGDPTFVELREILLSEIEPRITIRGISKASIEDLKRLIFSEVRPFYEDIDADFVRQVLSAGRIDKNAFSTEKKIVLEFLIGAVPIGYSVLTEKSYGAIKTGPTILKRQYRGVGVSKIVRKLIDGYCEKGGYKEVYCTSPSTKPEVIGGLIKAGYNIQAVLSSHLESSRNELVLSKRFGPLPKKTTAIKKIAAFPEWYKFEKLASESDSLESLAQSFSSMMPEWYFTPPQSLPASIISSVKIAERKDVKYSEKPRILFSARDSKRASVALALCTMKRSSMLKLNIVANSRSSKLIEGLLLHILRSTDFRRYYCTIPVDKDFVVLPFLNSGFKVEGVLQNPFNTGHDHFCFGYVR